MPDMHSRDVIDPDPGVNATSSDDSISEGTQPLAPAQMSPPTMSISYDSDSSDLSDPPTREPTPEPVVLERFGTQRNEDETISEETIKVEKSDLPVPVPLIPAEPQLQVPGPTARSRNYQAARPSSSSLSPLSSVNKTCSVSTVTELPPNPKVPEPPKTTEPKLQATGPTTRVRSYQAARISSSPLSSLSPENETPTVISTTELSPDPKVPVAPGPTTRSRSYQAARASSSPLSSALSVENATRSVSIVAELPPGQKVPVATGPTTRSHSHEAARASSSPLSSLTSENETSAVISATELPPDPKVSEPPKAPEPTLQATEPTTRKRSYEQAVALSSSLSSESETRAISSATELSSDPEESAAKRVRIDPTLLQTEDNAVNETQIPEDVPRDDTPAATENRPTHLVTLRFKEPESLAALRNLIDEENPDFDPPNTTDTSPEVRVSFSEAQIAAFKERGYPEYDEIDERLVKNPGCLVEVDPKKHDFRWGMVRSCSTCLDKRRFCDRGFPDPCGYCKKHGLEALCVPRTKEEGITAAPAHSALSQYKRRRKKVAQPKASKSDGDDTSTVKAETVSENKQSRGRPRKTQKREKVDKTEIQSNKPLPVGKPAVHAATRADLCDTLPYYRSYNAGLYTTEGFVHGYLLDGTPSPRDYMDGQIIISHCGGKSAEVDDSNERALIDDQFKDDNPVRCMLNNWQYKQPIVMIMGSKCPTSPTKMPHRYQVLDWFMITHAWTEPDPFSGHVRFKYRFEKVGLQESSWWAPQGMPGKNEEYLPAVAIEERECATCNKKSPRIYEEGFLCIHSTCQQFWKLDGQSAAHNLHYTQQFLRARHPVPPNYVVPSPLAPSIDGLLLDRNAELGNAHRDFWKGIVCPACGNCCARTSWKGWVCTCGYSREVGFHVTYTASQLREPHRDRYVGAPIPAINNRYNIPVKVETNGATTIVRYDLGPAVGTVIHVQNSDELNKKLGMDELLQRYQDPELPFKRGQVTTMCGTSYTRNFALNCGAAYHYVVDQDTVKMEDAPVVVQNVLSMLNEQVGKLCPGHRDFNEVLSLAYLEDMRMNYHTDDEVGLGPVVASLSLGAPARMGFRFRAGWKQNKLCHFPGLDVDDVKSGIPQFSVTLNHGDLLIMDGAGIQRYWEHSLTRVEGLFRIAATGRYIDPDTHEAASRPFGPTPAQRMAITSPKSETTVPTGEAQSTYMEDFFTHLHSIPKKEKSRRKSAVPTASATS